MNWKFISIHAPLTGSDVVYMSKVFVERNFNPRSPYGERPTSPQHRSRRIYNFNPRSPYGERRRCVCGFCAQGKISIHAPLTGSDPSLSFLESSVRVFQSTLPLRGATHPTCWSKSRAIISIHAPLTGSDRAGRLPDMGYGDFNPRSPYGERP